MVFTFTKVSNYGTTHPVVARLALQLGELVKWSAISEEKQKEILARCFEMKNRLLKCFELWNAIEHSIDTALAELVRARRKETGDKRVRYLPHAIGLEHNAELYLYQASNFLRDLAGILNLFFGTNFRSAKDFYHVNPLKTGSIPKWFTSRFGVHDPICEMLRENQLWIREFNEMRNAAQHPGGRSGKLTILNFQASSDGRLVAPIWFRSADRRGLVLEDLEAGYHNMLSFAEELLIFGCIQKTMRTQIVSFAEIPVEERRPEAPIRFRAVLLNPPGGQASVAAASA